MNSRPPTPTVPDVYGNLFTLMGLLAQLYAAPRMGIPRWLSRALAGFIALLCIFPYVVEDKSETLNFIKDWMDGTVTLWCLFWIVACAIIFIREFIAKRAVPDEGRRTFLKASTAVACAVPAAVFGTGFLTRKQFRVNEIDLKFPNLPKDLDGLRIVQISDVHLGAFFSRNDLIRVVDTCNELKAHIAFMTGDLITSFGDPLDVCLEELKRLKSDVGTLGCLGNHEMYAKVQNYTTQKAASMGMHFLRHERRSLQFGQSHLNVVGVDYQLPGLEPLRHVDRLVDPNQFNLLLSHSPAVFPTASKLGVQLMLSGHTHGGQLNLELAGHNFNIVDLRTPYTKGKYELDASTVYVNSGLGTIGVPVRIGAPPEISLIKLCAS